ncbi:MAG: trigger factor [Terriglobales bacterium]
MTSIETKSNCTREIQVEVPAEVVASQTETIIQRYQKLARLPGFRKGKAPATVIRQRFAEDVKSEVVEALVPKYFRQQSEKQGLTPVSQPRVTDLHIQEGEPLRFKATFEVLPEIEVTGYKELRPEVKDVSVGDDEVEAALKNVREQHASYNAVEDRPLALGDFAQVSFQGTPKEAGSEPGAKPSKPVNVDDVMVEIGDTNTVKEFSDNLLGAKPGETRTFDVAYPADFADQRLAGKTMSYSVTVKAIKNKQLPELNDDFAKELGDFANLDAVKQRIREGIEQEKKHAAEHEAKDKIVDELLKQNDFPVPEALVEQQIDLRLERGLRALAAQGMRAEDLKKMDLTRLRSGQRESAVKEVKVALILDRIADLEKIEVSDEEVNKEIESLATQSRQTVEAVRARLTRDGALDRIRHRIRNEKTLEYLFHQSA